MELKNNTSPIANKIFEKTGLLLILKIASNIIKTKPISKITFDLS